MSTIMMRIFRKLPFGFLPIARVRLGSGAATLRKDGWVIISDGKSTDALPISFCSEQVIQAFNSEFS